MNYPATRIDLTGRTGDEPALSADAFMPAQFYPARRGAASVEPSMRLMAAILIDAVRCFQRNYGTGESNRRQEFREAKSWIFDDLGNGPFSFREVCNWLEIDPRGLRDWIDRGQEGRNSGERLRMIRRAAVGAAKGTRSGRRSG